MTGDRPGEPGAADGGDGSSPERRRGRGWEEKAATLPECGGIEVAFAKEKEEEIQVQKSKYGDEGVGVAGKGVEGKKTSSGGPSGRAGQAGRVARCGRRAGRRCLRRRW